MPPRRKTVAARRPVRVTPYAVDIEPNAVTPREAALLTLQVAWQRWQEYARLLEEQMAGDGNDPRDGLILRTFGSTEDGKLYAAGEQIRALAVLEAEERDRVARAARMCHDMGIGVDDDF